MQLRAAYLLPVVGMLIFALAGQAWADAPADGGTAHVASPNDGGVTSDDFIRVEGTRFVLGSKEFVFVGANLAVIHGENERRQFRETLSAAGRDGLTVGRIWALGEGPADAEEWFRQNHLFRAGPDGFIESSYQHLDQVLAAAKGAGLRLIITLANNWSDYGGIPVYLQWVGGDPAQKKDGFYSDVRTRALYEKGLAKLLGRVNSVTGVRYVDDPTIFAWELINESIVETPDGVEARRRWIADMARFIKARDPHHLVAAGVSGYATRDERAEWIKVHRLPEIDYCDGHFYPQDATRVRSWKDLAATIDDMAQLARFVVGKPLVVGEFGFRGGSARGANWLGLPRTSWFRRFLQRLWYDGVSGALVWIYQPLPAKAQDYGIHVNENARASHDQGQSVRTALREAVSQLTAGLPKLANPLLGPALGEKLLYDPMFTIRTRTPAASKWRVRGSGAQVLDIPPKHFTFARFENVGTWNKGKRLHVYGTGAGSFEYRFDAPPNVSPPARFEITARLSSEWPGDSGPLDGTSPVRVLVDGAEIGQATLGADDGAGRAFTFSITSRPLLRRLSEGIHVLTFEVPDVPGAHGVCIYGPEIGPGGKPIEGDVSAIRLRYGTRRQP